MFQPSDPRIEILRLIIERQLRRGIVPVVHAGQVAPAVEVVGDAPEARSQRRVRLAPAVLLNARAIVQVLKRGRLVGVADARGRNGLVIKVQKLATRQKAHRVPPQRQVVGGGVGPVIIKLIGVGLRQLGRRVEGAVNAEGFEKLLVIGNAKRDAVVRTQAQVVNRGHLQVSVANQSVVVEVAVGRVGQRHRVDAVAEEGGRAHAIQLGQVHKLPLVVIDGGSRGPKQGVAHNAGPRIARPVAVARRADLPRLGIRKVGVGANLHVLRQVAAHRRAQVIALVRRVLNQSLLVEVAARHDVL